LVLETERFGKINYKKNDIITMAKGLLGFEAAYQFIVVSPEEQDPFKWLQSTDEPGLAFLIIDPLLIKPDYHIEISPKDLALLQAKSRKELITYLLVSIPEGQVEKMTANLQAPIIINKTNFQAAQLITSESGYVPQYPIFKALEQKLSGGA
jgi:flagellar assembly factor FliW